MGQALEAFMRGAVGLFSESVNPPARGMLEGITPGAIGEPPPRGTLQHLQVYSETPWVRAIVGRIADSVASLEWRLYVAGRPTELARRDVVAQRARGASRRARLKALADQGGLREIESHLFLDAWALGNGFQTGHAMRKTTQIHLESTGDVFLLKERNGLGAPVAYWPVPSNWMLSTPTPTRPFYRVSYRAWQATIPETEVVWMTDPNPLNPYGRGTGFVRALGDEIETDEYAAKMTKQFFFNNARPDFLVMPKEGESIDEPAARRMELSWTQRLGGFWNRWKPIFLSRAVEIKEFEKDFRAGQFVQIRQHERDICLQTWGVPPEVLGVIENSNRATIEAADYLYNANVIVPRAEFLRATIQERILPEYDARLIVDYVSPVSEDRTHVLEVAKAAPWAREVDEWRTAQGLEPLLNGAGKVFMVPTNVRAVAAPAEAQAIQPQSFGGEGMAPQDQATPPRGLAALDDEELRTLRQLTAKAGG